jgi:DNA-binding response OmpR family regulator
MPGRPIVLVADDEPVIRRLYTRVLSTAGYEVIEAVDGEEALARLATTKVALLLLDATMPRLDGLAVIQRLRAAAGTARLPIVLVTGAGAEADRIRALDLGADDYLIKPFSITELVACVRRHARVAPRSNSS